MHLTLGTNGTWDAFPNPKSWKFRGHIKTLIKPLREHNLLEITSDSLSKHNRTHEYTTWKYGHLRNDGSCSRNSSPACCRAVWLTQGPLQQRDAESCEKTGAFQQNGSLAEESFHSGFWETLPFI